MAPEFDPHDQLAVFRAAMDQAQEMSKEVAAGASVFWKSLIEHGVWPEAATTMTVEWIAQLMSPILVEVDEEED